MPIDILIGINISYKRNSEYSLKIKKELLYPMKERFKNIDLLRFVFAILIVMFHARHAVIKGTLEHVLPGLKHCNACVEFFFMIAGFFLFYTINTKQSTFEFAKKRFLRLAPLVWFFLVIVAILSFFISYIQFPDTSNILRVFLLNNIGFAPPVKGIGAIIHWFIPVLFWVSLFYFYITKIIDKKYLNLIMWLITIISLGMKLNNSNFLTCGNAANIYYFINIGILRGLYGMGIGYFIAQLYKSGFLHKCSKVWYYIISGLEIYCIIFLTYYLLFTSRLPGQSGFLYILIFSILFYLFLIKKGFISKLFDNNISAKLGSYSYAIYVMHPLITSIFAKLVYIQANSTVMTHIMPVYCFEIILAVLTGILTHYIFEKPINKLIKSKNW